MRFYIYTVHNNLYVRYVDSVDKPHAFERLYSHEAAVIVTWDDAGLNVKKNIFKQ